MLPFFGYFCEYKFNSFSMIKLFSFLLLGISVFGFAQQETPIKTTVEAACASCMFDKNDKSGCLLAVKIEGKIYYVKGTGIDDHGDAHSKTGFCNAIRKAEIEGSIKGDEFIAKKFKVLPL